MFLRSQARRRLTRANPTPTMSSMTSDVTNPRQVCLSLQRREQDALQDCGTPNQPQATSRGKTPHQGTQHPLRDERLAKAKSRTYASRVFPPRWFCCPSSFSFLSYASWAACTSKGSSRASCLESSYLSKHYAPPGLVEPLLRHTEAAVLLR